MGDETPSINDAWLIDGENGMQEATNHSASSGSSTFFLGPIPLAISTAQRENKILMVYIGGDDAESKELEENTWRDSKLLEEVQRSAVALKLIGSSSDANYFSALYPIQVVPSITFIGCNGSMLSQHEGYVNAQELLEKLLAAREAMKLLLQNAAASAILAALSSARQPADSSTIPSSSIVKKCTASRSSEISNTEVEVNNNSTTAGENGSETSKGDLEHVSGQNLSQSVNLEPSNVDVSAESSHIDSTSEKDGVVNPLSTGNSSRSSKVNVTLERDGNPKVQSEAPILIHTETSKDVDCKRNLKAAEVLVAESEHIKSSLEDVLLQIRLTNGQVIRGQFKPTDCLSAVMDLVDRNCTEMSNYSLAIPFPRKVFSTEEISKSLSDLRIESRAALIVVLKNKIEKQEGASVVRRSTTPTVNSIQEEQSNGGSFLGRALSYLNPLSYLSWAFAERQASPGSSTWQYDPNPTYGRPVRDGIPETPAQLGNLSNFGNIQRFSSQGSNTTTQRRGWGSNGNIHTLDHNEEDIPRKSNSYWNGNSTEFGGEDDSKR